MAVHAQAVQGDPEVMLRCLVEEYARLGLSQQRILSLFETPLYTATHQLKQHFGEDGLRQRVAAVISRCGIHRVVDQPLSGTTRGDDDAQGD